MTPAATTSQVLIVDDDLGIRRRLKDLLLQKGYTVETAATCREGIERATHAAEETPYRFALIDVRLPDGLGLEVLKTIKKLTPGTVCLMMTGTPDEATEAAARSAGAQEYYTKPLTIDQLVDLMGCGGYLG